MDAQDFRDRTKKLALQILTILPMLPKTTAGWAIGKQIVRSGTSIGANYRSACKARSRRDFVSKITIAEEEADETMYWLELIRDGGLIQSHVIDPIYNETKEVTAMLTASGRTARHRLNKP